MNEIREISGVRDRVNYVILSFYIEKQWLRHLSKMIVFPHNNKLVIISQACHQKYLLTILNSGFAKVLITQTFTTEILSHTKLSSVNTLNENVINIQRGDLLPVSPPSVLLFDRVFNLYETSKAGRRKRRRGEESSKEEKKAPLLRKLTSFKIRDPV